MTNKTNIKGDNNINLSGIKSSKVSIGGTAKPNSNGKFWVIAGVIVAVVAVLLQIIIGWQQIIEWIYAR